MVTQYPKAAPELLFFAVLSRTGRSIVDQQMAFPTSAQSCHKRSPDRNVAFLHYRGRTVPASSWSHWVSNHWPYLSQRYRPKATMSATRRYLTGNMVRNGSSRETRLKQHFESGSSSTTSWSEAAIIARTQLSHVRNASES